MVMDTDPCPFTFTFTFTFTTTCLFGVYLHLTLLPSRVAVHLALT
jgi:hypothetical protein